MGLESASYINNLDLDNPEQDDSVSQGDDHLRLLKKVLKQTMPGTGGQGWAKPIISTEDELNSLAGTSENINDHFEALKTKYVQTNDGDQEINGKLTVHQSVIAISDTPADFAAFSIKDANNYLQAALIYNETDNRLDIALRKPNSNETVALLSLHDEAIEVSGELHCHHGIRIFADTPHPFNGLEISFGGKIRLALAFHEVDGAVFLVQRDVNGADETVLSLNGGLGFINGQQLLTTAGVLTMQTTNGASGTFEDNAGKTITVTNGLITDLG